MIRALRRIGFQNLSALLLILISFQAAVAAQSSSEQKTLRIWGREVQYQIEIREDPSLSFDGEARESGGPGHFQIFLNTAFLAPEADKIFEALRKSATLPQVSAPNENSIMRKIESDFMSGRRISRGSLHHLEAWKEVLESAAWKPALLRCQGLHSELPDLRQCFRGEFAQIRLGTIEYHEASHLLDLAKSPAQPSSREFNRRSELNAFFAELAYGENPLDVMSQALAGWLEEARRGGEVDASTDKVRKILEFIETHPRFADRLKSGKSPTCCLELLREMAVQDFQMAGRSLYALN